MKRFWLFVVLFANGCATSVVLPERGALGAGVYTGVENVEDYNLYIPQSLLRAETFAEARACAVAFNDASKEGNRCGGVEGTLRVGQLAAVGMATVSAGVSGLVESDAAQRHWRMAAIGSTAVLGVLTGFDLWLNCGERTWVQKTLATERLAKLNNAGRLASCGTRFSAFERVRRDAELKVGELKNQMEAQKSSLVASGKQDQVNAFVARVDGLNNALEGPKPVAEDIRQAVNDLSATATQLGAGGKLDELKKDLTAKAEEAIPLVAVLCRDVAKAAGNDGRQVTAGDYMDAAHKELVECLTGRFTQFGTAPVVGP
ncbi:hypothetical protein JYK02_00535 [Corallococcus macrosporus]|uniref:Lipoprotein n=1 Tax=Corallococcus macrosporus TaxID=35 RepID=A0ABS3D4L0_9BACT|nr:hypothetical protein [Corallococcus macrosporus]MBN8225991.1 hypothetical protein [Corallococcus macrosporus]